MSNYLVLLRHRLAAPVLLILGIVAFSAFRYGIGKAFLVALLIVCAYVNGFFLMGLPKARSDSKARLFILVAGVLVGNGALIYLSKFNLLVAVVAWLPSLAAILAVVLLRRQ